MTQPLLCLSYSHNQFNTWQEGKGREEREEKRREVVLKTMVFK
jgi:hypothetical protein